MSPAIRASQSLDYRPHDYRPHGSNTAENNAHHSLPIHLCWATLAPLPADPNPLTVMSYKYAVVVPFDNKFISPADINGIGTAIKNQTSELLWKSVDVGRRDQVDRFRVPTLPTIMLNFHRFNPRVPLRQFTGRRIEIMPIHKVVQLRQLEEAGIRVPKWTRLDPDTEIDPAEFGEFLIVKPTDERASLGRGITLIRTREFGKFRDQYAERFIKMGQSPPLVQQYIPTGGKAEHYRISTFLGRVVSCRRTEQANEAAINAPVRELVLNDKVASNAGGSAEKATELCRDAEVEALGLRVAELFDSVTDGIDIVRSSQDGELYILEINMGNTWHFSSALGAGVQNRLGAETMRNQFDLYDTVAAATIDRARLILDVN